MTPITSNTINRMPPPTRMYTVIGDIKLRPYS
jgi:hypothetical protein